MSARSYRPWGRLDFGPQRAVPLRHRFADLPAPEDGASLLAYGNGRSYGDACQNTGGLLIDCRHLDRFIAFDAEGGTLRCEAGVLLSEILAVIVPRGWFLPVTPGTRFVTVGGAIANDVHGKNHHRAGTFGCHVRRFELLRSDGRRLVCSREENEDLFRATIGGVGLTGVVTWAELSLRRIDGPFVEEEIVRFRDLEEFFDLSARSDEAFEHTVAWLDCAATGRSLGRGLFMRANHAPAPRGPAPTAAGRQVRFPFEPPVSLVNRPSLRLFNALYYHRQRRDRRTRRVHYRPFFHPLDSIRDWNRLYGPRGFYQYQNVLAADGASKALREMLERIAARGAGSFLAVLKIFGAPASPGLLSFPRPGPTLALDFPNHGAATLALLDELDAITLAHGGAVYPAKDARMAPAVFRASFPALDAFIPLMDPAFSSSLWRRVTGAGRR